MITIKRIPTEPETYEVWLIPESVGFDASFGVRGAVRAEAVDLSSDACHFAGMRDALHRLRVTVDDVGAALTEAGMSDHGTPAERVVRLRDERESLRAELRRSEAACERYLAMLRPASSSWNQR